MMKNRIYLTIIATLLFMNCQSTKKEVILKNDKGEAKLLYEVKTIDGKKQRVGEEMRYDNGKTKYKGSFKNGVPHGKWKYYYEDGTLFASCEFDSTASGSQWKFYNQKGARLHEKASVLVPFLTQNKTPILVYFAEGEKQYEYQFFDNFQTKSSGYLVEGQKTGQWTFWFLNGKVQTFANFENNVFEGEQIVYYENGNVFYKGSYEKGERKGEWIFYDENGKETKRTLF